jgi:hypothetical protein
MLVPTNLLGADNFGIVQRIFLAVWLSWPITLTVSVRRHAALDSSGKIGRVDIGAAAQR